MYYLAVSTDLIMHLLVCLMAFTTLAAFTMGAGNYIHHKYKVLETRYDRALNQQLLMNVSIKLTLFLFGVMILGIGLSVGLYAESLLFFAGVSGAALFLPDLIVKHFEQKRLKKLNEQIVDGVTSLASGVRAGLNLVQSIELLIQNGVGPIKQEFEQLHREYQLGMDLNQAMHNASDRIGSPYYRLLFGAIGAHRTRGGDLGQSLDRIADSIREIQRLEGRLDALTAQGRAQANFMGIMPFVILGILSVIMPGETKQLFTEPVGRVLLLVAIGFIAAGFVWIRQIMRVDM